MDQVTELARELARERGHKDVDAIIQTTNEGPVPVWRFYVENAARVIATMPGMTPAEARAAGVEISE